MLALAASQEPSEIKGYDVVPGTTVIDANENIFLKYN